MTPEQNRQRWKETIELWRGSGLSGAAWCRQNGVKYDLFLYYKRRCSPESPFREVTDTSTSTGISIQIKDATIRVEKTFDPHTLKQVMMALTHARP